MTPSTPMMGSPSSPRSVAVESSPDTSLEIGEVESSPSKQQPVKSLTIGDDDPEDVESEDEDDNYRLTLNPDRPRKITEKKRLDNAAFQSWMVQNQREVTKKAQNPAGSEPKDLGHKSISRMLEESENRKIIASPREYQVELFEKAKQKNTIVVLDTGSGKTLIAALLLRHILNQEMENRAVGKPKKVAFFLVEKVALCFQQYTVLTSNLEYPIAKFYGDMTGIMRTKEFWDAQFEEHMAVVCTAQILLDCLNNGFIKMKQINLLIFDEAHHTKKNHPYACIIKNHYIREKNKPPRILGMTASPVDTKTNDLQAAALVLESLLCSEIATVSDETLRASESQKNLQEVKETYWKLPRPDQCLTPLWDAIGAEVGYNDQFRAPLMFTKEACAVLGKWCADRFWQLYITDSEIARLAARTENDGAKDMSRAYCDKAIESVRKVQKIVEQHEFLGIHKRSRQLSSKTRMLHRVIEEAFVENGFKRCIVFVEKRYTAVVLADLFQQERMRIPGVSASYMVGCQSNSSGFGNMSFRDQVLALQQFRQGETNCMFATPVAEEGIDVPECDLIIRFDLFTSVIQYLQSKGRARQKHSRYVAMVEDGNVQHTKTVHGALYASQALRRFCTSLPEDRRLKDENIDAIAAAQHEMAYQKTYDIESTGARLTLAHSLDVLAKFVSSLTVPGETNAKAEYMITSVGRKFVADVVLPDSSPIRTKTGFPQRGKLLAKCSAAFEMCVALIKKKYINEHFQPVFAKKLPAMRNARLAVSANKKADYNMLMRPEIWLSLGEEVPKELFMAAITFDNPDAVGRMSRPMLLLTRQRIPAIPDIPLFFGNGQASLAKVINQDAVIQVKEAEMAGLMAFTLKLFADVFSKEYEAAPQEIPYFLAPCLQDHGQVIAKTQADIDWSVIEIVQENEYLPWEDAPEDFFPDKFIIDPYDGSRKMIIKGINKDLKPFDPTPEGVPEAKSRSYRLVEPIIKEYSNSLWLKSRQKRTWRDDQPVFTVELLSLRRNLLDEFQLNDDDKNECYVILEPLKVSPIPVDVVAMVMTFPAIIHRIDDAIIALDACALVGLTEIKPSLALEALTKDSDNTEEHGGEQVNFQAGMGNNYERLEFLGDSFLKMATTISLFTLTPDSTEFEYHVERMLLICNQNLFNHAVDRKLQEYVRSKAFDRRAWYPDLRLKKGKAPKKELRHSLADKSIADVCEALIGAAYLTADGSDHEFDLAVRAVTQMVKSKNHKMLAFKDYYAAFKIPKWQSGPSSAAQRFTVEQVAKSTGYEFKSAPLLRSAFKHPSYPYETIPNYQRLEFLGDALLDMAIVDYLFKRFPAADPQWLTEHKMAMASNQFLGCVCVNLSLHKHLLFTTSALMGQITDYVNELEVAREDADATTKQSFWLNASQPPKALPDMVEALIGAMFVDSGYDYAVVQSFFTRFIEPHFEDMALYDTFAQKHPVTFLAHKMQQELFCTQWRIMTGAVPCDIHEGVAAATQTDVVCAFMVHGNVFAHATAKSGRYAKIAVAKKALARIEELESDDAIKAEMQCDCQPSAEELEAMKNGLERCGAAV